MNVEHDGELRIEVDTAVHTESTATKDVVTAATIAGQKPESEVAAKGKAKTLRPLGWRLIAISSLTRRRWSS